MDSVLVTLSAPGRLAVERIKAAGFADDDVGAIRVAVADMASRLAPGPLASAAAPSSLPRIPTPRALVAQESVDSHTAAKRALEIVLSDACICRLATGRHHVLKSLLEALARDGTANWLEVLERARASAIEFNERFGFSPSQPPANVAYTPAAMSQNWMRGYIHGGAGKFKERYSHDGPSVATTATPTGNGVRIDLAK